MTKRFSELDIVDALINRRLFKDKKQAYESGVILMDLLARDPNLISLKKLDQDLFYSKLREILQSLKRNQINAVSDDLSKLAHKMGLRCLLGRLFEDPDSENYGILSDTISRYSEVLSKYNTYEQKQKKYIISDLKRDLNALMEYLDDIKGESQEEKVVYHQTAYEHQGEYHEMIWSYLKPVYLKTMVEQRKMTKQDDRFITYPIQTRYHLEKPRKVEEVYVMHK